MLAELYIENIAVIQKASIHFKDGFHVFTGETGAGKTILISAINAVLGARTYREIIRTGEEHALVTALFTELSPEISEKISALGYPVEDGQIMVQRTLDLDGRGSCKIDGKPATVALLREVSSLLIDIHGQHDNQELLSAERHLSFLDNFGDYGSELADYQAVYEKWETCRKKLEKLETDESSRLQRLDTLQFQLQEIGKAELEDGEEEELELKKKRIRNSEKITETLGRIYELLQGDDDGTPGVMDSLEEMSGSLDQAAKFLPELTDYNSKISDAYYTLEDLQSIVRDTLEDSDFDPRMLDEVESRLDVIYRLKKKYGGSIAEILDYYEKINLECEELSNSDELIETLKEQFSSLKKELRTAADRLTACRMEAALRFTDRVKNELQFLDMANVVLKISRTEKDFSPNGCDEVEFLISTNAGEEARPLAKIASGGELARIMLAIKNVLAEKDDIGTIIFDEVDTGVSGRAAQKIGVKLAEVAKHRQVICVTHLAPVAAQASHHYKIYKTVEGGRTFTKVEELSEEARVRELARIMVGENITESALESARELMKKDSAC